MKKVFALVLCLALVFALSVTAFAEAAVSSPAADSKNVVIVRKADATVDGADIKLDYWYDSTGKVTKVTANAKFGAKFNGFKLYVYTPAEGANPEKAAPAVQGKDYEVVSGSLTSNTFEFKPLNDLIVCANYDGLITEPLKTSDQSGTAPKTGDMTVAYAAIVMLVAAASVFGVKKVYSK